MSTDLPTLPIDRGIELWPARSSNHSRKPRWRFPWDELEPGDSFLVPGMTQHQASAHTAQAARSRPGVTYTTRSTPDGTRIWRIT